MIDHHRMFKIETGKKMKRKTSLTILILLVAVLSISLSACTGRSSMTASGWPGITVDNNSAYIAFNSQIIAVNIANGTERWRFPSEPDAKITFFATPALTNDGYLIVGGYDNVVYRINKETGQGAPIFEGADGRYIGGPIVTEDMIFVPSADNVLYGLNPNGQEIWQFESGEPLWAKPSVDSKCECVYLSSMDHKVYALDAKSGGLIWSSDDLSGAIVDSPTKGEDNTLYVGTFNKEIVALDSRNGRELWRFATNDWVWASPALEGDTLYFGDLSGTFYAVNRITGVSKWQIQPGGAIVGTPLITEDALIFGTETGSLISVNKNGSIIWNQPYETELHTGPISNGETILITTSDPETLLFSIDPSGVQKWSYKIAQ